MLSGILCAILCTTLPVVGGSHFRGGTASWKLISSNGNDHEIEMNYRLGWRRDSNNPGCDDDMILSQVEAYDEGSWSLYGASSYDFPHSTAIKCTVYEPDENWAYGYNSFRANITSSSNFDIIFASGDWIGGLYRGSNGHWSVGLLGIDLGIRSDTGNVNNPPRTLNAPIVRLQLGCPSTIIIQALDDDNDDVTCRYATGSDECGDVCGGFPYITLVEKTCTLEYNGGGRYYLVAIALMLEDHPKQTITVDGSTITTSNVLSKIPLQFIIDISSASSCNINPTYPPYSIQDGETFVISDTETFNETLYAYPSVSGGSITQFVVIGPLGLHQSEITDNGNDLFSSNMIWDATSDQSGDHTVCYYAVDSKGLHSEQRCFTITVTAFSTVECDGLTTNISIANCASEEVIFAGEHNNLNSECQSTRGTSQQHLSLTSGQCGMTTESSAAGIQYATVIYVYKEDTAGSSSVITRGEWVQISVVCTLPASSNLTGSFVPEVPITGDNVQNEVSIEGMGTFVFSFDIYRTESFTTAYSPAEYPVEVSIDDDIYFALQAVGRGDLTLFTEECVALSTETITPTTLEYPFISAGCLEDPTMEKYLSDNPLENRFSIQAFQFADKLLASKEDAAVYIQCSVLLCDLSNTTRCYQGCVSSTFRDKRSILQHDSIVRANLAKNDSDNQDVEDDDDDEIPLTTKESSPQTISNALVLIFDDDGGNDNDGGNGSKRKAVTTAWIAFLLGVIIFHRLE
uniref:uncharacterized protein LOC120328850 isoform X2 n=1 Tax=Styela clava TaxID=7725 RepID=UPI00193A2155|nr:uncharacterized protein LOC120328850 isoform X2 [Styela clava]